MIRYCSHLLLLTPGYTREVHRLYASLLGKKVLPLGDAPPSADSSFDSPCSSTKFPKGTMMEKAMGQQWLI